MSFISYNSISSKTYNGYASSMANLAHSMERISTGKQRSVDISGLLGVADRMRQKYVGSQSLVTSMENAKGYAETQDEILGEVSDIYARMSELAASALDTTKSTADRTALDTEFRALNTEIVGLLSRKYNGVTLFSKSTQIRTGIETTDILTFRAITLAAHTVTGLSISQLSTASQAYISLTGRIASLAIRRSRVISSINRVDRLISSTQEYMSNLQEAMDPLVNVDTAREAARLANYQARVQLAQAVLAQANSNMSHSERFLS